MNGLNPRQTEAVTYAAGPLLVIAGAGSGKTRTIAHKIAYLITHRHLPAQAIRALTFTNKAAREMKARVQQLLPRAATRGLMVGTFHTFGLQMLRRAAPAVGLRPGFSLFDPQDVETVLADHLAHLGLAAVTTPAAVAARISRWKNELIAPSAAAQQAEDEFEAQLARIYAAYERSLRAYNAVDFDDLIGLPVRWLRAAAAHRTAWQRRIGHLLIDEYQDTNWAQYVLIKLLTWPDGIFTAVGDDDQAIYAWRGARPENLAQLQRDYPRLKVIVLEQNYRSSARILQLANGLIQHNPHLFTKRLWSTLGPGERPRLLLCRDETDEAERVVAEIVRAHCAEQRPFGDYAILYRSNHQARPFEEALRAQRIPYFLSGGTSFFDRVEIKDVLAYLRLLANPDDDAAFLRIINVPRREIGAATLEKLAAYASARGISLLRATTELGLATRLDERARARLIDFAALLACGRERAVHDPLAAVRALLTAIDYDAWLHATAASRLQAERRAAQVEALFAWLERLRRGGLDTLAEWVARLTVLEVLDRQDAACAEDRVQLMTLHAAKGLEFPYVFLVGMEEELLPHRNSIEDDDIAEERRLAYVGITRARRGLTLTLAHRRRRHGELVESTPSRFLAELPEGVLAREETAATQDPSARRARAAAHLAAMRALLARRAPGETA